jgi:acyl dehydratase
LIGAGIDQLRWPIPVYPGDELSLDIEIIDIRRSESKPDNGIVKVKILTKNQSNRIVMSYIATLVMKSKNSLISK